MLFGAAFLIMTAQNPKLGFIATTSDGVPGGGFFPYLLSILIIFMSIVLIVRSIIRTPEKYIEITPETKINTITLFSTIIGLVVFLVIWSITADLFGNIAFLICVFIFEVFLNKLFKRSWKFTIIYSAVFTAFIYAVFNLGFKIMFNA